MIPALQLNNLSVHYEQQQVLDKVSLTLESGDILGLLGSSGCGKTTLLNTVAGFIRQSQGEILIGSDIRIDSNHEVKAEHRHVGMIFQDYALFPHLKVKDNIAFGLKDLNAGEKVAKVEQLLSLLHLPQLAERYPHELSGGQQQRVAIARSLAFEPKLLLLDEPFSNIDARLRTGLMTELRKLLKSLNMSAIFVTHNKDEVFVFADKMAVMGNGKILQCDRPAKVCAAPASWQVADFLQLGNIVGATMLTEQLIETDFGRFTLPQAESLNLTINHQLLLKPQHLTIQPDKKANARVININVSEHGFRVTLASIAKPELEIHLFHPQELVIGNEVAVTIADHQPIIF